MVRPLALMILILSTAAPPPQAAPRAGAAEKCPVCGMFVAKYPDWMATVTFRDGSRAVFDGAKDLLVFWQAPGRYLPGRTRADVVAITVTDYYSLEAIDGRAAFYVEGSDVLGPMGRELVPFARREAAEEFLTDHGGRKVLRFDEITPELLRALDR